MGDFDKILSEGFPGKRKILKLSFCLWQKNCWVFPSRRPFPGSPVDFWGGFSDPKDSFGKESFGPWEKTDRLYNQGIQEGREESKKEIALNLIKDDLDSLIISKVTGLTIRQIEVLKKGY